MAKGPRKSSAAANKTAGYSQKLNPKLYKTPRYGGKGGKSLRGYNFQPKRDRRLSLVSDTSDQIGKQYSHSDSESSLTAMSEDDENAASRRGSVFFAPKHDKKLRAKLRRVLPGKSGKKVLTKVYKAHYENESDGDDDDDEDNDDNAIAEDALSSFYSMAAPASSESESDSGSDLESSSDDSEADFVRLQLQKRAQSMKTLRAIKGLPKQDKEAKDPKQEKDSKQEKQMRRRRSSVYSRRGDVVLPDEFNFKFEFDDTPVEVEAPKIEEEDLGEEVLGSEIAPGNSLKFDFLEDEYEFDDNDLLATLQADNDMDEFITEAPVEPARTRQSSISSVNDDTEDPFLREEEKYLVNEFEVNGFDDEPTNAQKKQALQYASSDDQSEFDDYMDILDFDTPVERKPMAIQPRKQGTPKSPNPLDSDDDDDSYLWNYFLSSNEDSDGAENGERFMLDQLHDKAMEGFELEDIGVKSKEPKDDEDDDETKVFDIGSFNVRESSGDSDRDYDSGESTDVEVDLPASVHRSQAGLKIAKEVLSSKTADYRPPVLGTWVAVACKPFGIIDGLSTRMVQQSGAKNPRKGWSLSDSEDSAIELDELLNISELDNDDENDIRIWRDFNNNKKKHVPLGAFRNKLHISDGGVFGSRSLEFGDHRVRKPIRQKARLDHDIKTARDDDSLATEITWG